MNWHNNNSGCSDWKTVRTAELMSILDQLLKSIPVPFDEQLRGRLPNKPGIYAIYEKAAAPGEVLRAGCTKTAAGGLRQRIYQNHFQGNQKGNLRYQLVRNGVCVSLSEAKSWIRTNCVVQFTVVEDNEMRQWAEYMMLAVWRPRYCD
ncbi:hypothetical protein [Pseudacidobacterium ailaaui]|uniref:hypothetical protein n=1 Tax=Pseudacidobacterium ailaaui TaxID=1382359 RepID=UPI00047A7A9C|nr:hypothetical protein [Pseudacidobacterium ailaaui]